MTDLRKGTGSKAALTSGTTDSARRKDLHAGRRAFRAWPLLQVPPGAKARRTVDVAWAKGTMLDGAEEWQDRADRRDVGRDFVPSCDERPWSETSEPASPKRGAGALKAGLLASVVFHLSLAAFFISMPSPDAAEIAGSGEVAVMLVGEQAFDSLAAGKPDTTDTQTPVEETKAVEVEKPLEATTTEEVVETADDDAMPSEPVSELQPMDAEPVEEQAAEAPTELAPTPPEVVASANENVAIDPRSVSEAGELAPATAAALEPEQPVEKPLDTAATSEVSEVKPEAEVQPLPGPAKPEKTVAKKVEKPEPKERKEKKVTAKKRADKNQEERAQKSTDARGQGGQSTANAQRGASDNANRSESAEPGNAAVSNYPGKVAAKLRRALKYPRSAVSGSRSGEAQVAFTVQADGSATGIRVVSSSGSPVLDQAAIDAVRHASPFPPIPEGAGRRQWPFAVPVLFRR